MVIKTNVELRLNSTSEKIENGISILNLIALQSEDHEITKAIHGVLEVFKKAEQELDDALR